jgi:DNA-binding response OmpR family regulator/anti-anti-sigma regulatory factor
MAVDQRGEPPIEPQGVVLIIDDNAAHLGVLASLLEQTGFEVAVAQGGLMGLELVSSDPPAVILLDVVMPGIDGYETCRRLKAEPKTRDIPVIFMSSLTDEAYKLMGLDLGAVDYINKPVQPNEVLARIRIHLKLRAITQALVERTAQLEREVAERTAAENTFKDLALKLEERVQERTAELLRVVRELRQTQAQLEGSNERLKAEIATQTAELRRANSQLEAELAERQRSEQERALLQTQIIEAQKARLAELSTPMIPITDQIMVMPLVGAIDADRAENLLTTALSGVSANKAQVVIIDITGVQSIDASVAYVLARSAQALRLIGAQAIITGIRAEVAQLLVGLAVDLGSIVTAATLQSGIGQALLLVGAAQRSTPERGLRQRLR